VCWGGGGGVRSTPLTVPGLVLFHLVSSCVLLAYY
jgi:hypothetical protein